MHFCEETYRAERLERKELAQNGCEFWGFLLYLTEITAPGLCWTAFLQEKKKVWTCWNSFKSSTHWCSTPSWRSSACAPVQHTTRKPSVQCLLPRYKDRNIPRSTIVFPLGIRCRNTNKVFNAGKKALPSTAMTQATQMRVRVRVRGGYWKHQDAICWGITWIPQDAAFSVPPASKTRLRSIM